MWLASISVDPQLADPNLAKAGAIDDNVVFSPGAIVVPGEGDVFIFAQHNGRDVSHDRPLSLVVLVVLLLQDTNCALLWTVAAEMVGVIVASGIADREGFVVKVAKSKLTMI